VKIAVVEVLGRPSVGKTYTLKRLRVFRVFKVRKVLAGFQGQRHMQRARGFGGHHAVFQEVQEG
jgi:hypothetical protein